MSLLKRSKRSSKTQSRSNLRASHGILPQDGRVFSYITDIPRTPPLGLNTFTVTKSVLSLGYLSTSITLPTFATVAFAAGQIDDYAELATVFDQYRINSVEVFFTNSGSNLNIANTGRLVTVLDFDDTTPLTTVALAEDYVTAVTSSCQSSQYRHFVPRMALAAYQGAFTGYANTAPMWIDAATSGVQFYGVKIAATVTSSVMVFDLMVRYNISWRAVR